VWRAFPTAGYAFARRREMARHRRRAIPSLMSHFSTECLEQDDDQDVGPSPVLDLTGA
jgi:hypothetical protein